jgi:hypothetical protein
MDRQQWLKRLERQDPGGHWLVTHGCRTDGTSKKERRTAKSIHAVSTPVGGAPRRFGARYGR